MSADWAAVYRTSFTDLVRYLYRKVWDAERAQDLAQEAFARVLAQERRGGSGEIENPRALVFTVAANLARDEARTVIRRRKHLALLKSDAAAAEPEDRDPVDEMQRESERQLAQDALRRLSERDQEVLLLWDAGMSYAINDQFKLGINVTNLTDVVTRQTQQQTPGAMPRQWFKPGRIYELTARYEF